MENSHTRLVSKTIGLLDSMIKSGEQHDETSVKMIGLSRAALHGLERQLEDLQNIVEKVAYSIEVNDEQQIELKKVFNPISLITEDGERMVISMRDSGFEFNYEGKNYFAKEGYVEPFNKSSRGNYLVNQKHIEIIDVVNNTNKD